MKKIIILLLIIGYFTDIVRPEPVSRFEAEKIATIWYNHIAELNYCSIKDVSIRSNDHGTSFYIFEFIEGGFVIVAGDDASLPILACSAENSFPMEINCPSIKEWMDNYSEEISYISKKNLENKSTIRKWNDIRNEIFPESTKDVGPLLTTTWAQNTYYNEMCPPDPSGPGGHCYTGCVATAIAQILRYHEFPPQGIGTYSYHHPAYGVQSVNFGSAIYDWSAMPDFLTSSNLEVAKIMYHSGVSVMMNYGPNGSGAYIERVQQALINYFNYDPDISLLCQQDYSLQMESWKELIRNDLDNSLPVFYTGDTTTTGHAFVCDGYRLSDETFHFNWGWGGNYNGWYIIGSLNPGSNHFNNNNWACFNIEPGNPDLIVRINNPNDNEIVKAGTAINIICSTVRGSADKMIISIDDSIVKTGTSNNLVFPWSTSKADLGSHHVIAYSIADDDTVMYPINLNISDWMTQTSGLPQTHSIEYISAVDNNIAWAISIYTMNSATQLYTRTIDGGDTWTSGTIPGCYGLQPTMIFGLSDTKAYVTMMLYTGNNPKGVYVTENGGLTWTHQASAAFNSPYSYPCCVHFFNENDGWCMGDPTPSTGNFEIYTTSNGGTNWLAVPVNNIPLPISGEFGFHGGYSAINDTIWFGTNKNRVYRSVDRGYGWEVYDVPSLDGDFLMPVFRNGAHGIVHNFIGQAFNENNPPMLYETSDGGETWSAVPSAGPMYNTSLAYVPGMGNTWISSGGWLWPESGVSVSYDGGYSWTDFPGTHGAKFRAMGWVNDSCGWAGSYSINDTEGGVYKFTGNLLPWPEYIHGDTVNSYDVILNWGTPVGYVSNLNFLGYNIYRDGIKLNSSVLTATNYLDQNVVSGLHEYCVTAVYEERESNPAYVEVYVPLGQSISENDSPSVIVSPNPFSAITTLTYTLSKTENVQFTIYNVQSQIVFMKQERHNSGEQKMKWNADGLPAGMYYFRIKAGDKVGSGKMVKVK